MKNQRAGGKAEITIEKEAAGMGKHGRKTRMPLLRLTSSGNSL